MVDSLDLLPGQHIVLRTSSNPNALKHGGSSYIRMFITAAADSIKMCHTLCSTINISCVQSWSFFGCWYLMRKFRCFTTTVPSTVGLAIEQNVHYDIQMSLTVHAAGIHSKLKSTSMLMLLGCRVWHVKIRIWPSVLIILFVHFWEQCLSQIQRLFMISRWVQFHDFQFCTMS